MVVMYGQAFAAPQQERVLHSVYRDASTDFHDEDSDEDADCAGPASAASEMWSKTTYCCRGTFARFLRAAAAGLLGILIIFLCSTLLPNYWVEDSGIDVRTVKTTWDLCSDGPKDGVQHSKRSRMATLEGRLQDMMTTFGGNRDSETQAQAEVFTDVCGQGVSDLFVQSGDDFYQGVIDCVGLLGLCTTNCLGRCLQGKFPVVPIACGQCFEVGAVCGKEHCWEECALHGKTSIECRNCAKRKCGGSLQTEMGFREAYVYSLREGGCNSEFYKIFEDSRGEDTGWQIPSNMQTCTGLVFNVLMNIRPAGKLPPDMRPPENEDGSVTSSTDRPSILSRIREDVR